ncbi:hypothetical protein M5E87_07265 [Flavonifractor plautii]|nr:hypothetical protein M5E87_07265 [Flavonifractor plautii]
MSTAIVITSGKGGTGKTSITGGVASCLAALGHRCSASTWISACATWT